MRLERKSLTNPSTERREILRASALATENLHAQKTQADSTTAFRLWLVQNVDGGRALATTNTKTSAAASKKKKKRTNHLANDGKRCYASC